MLRETISFILYSFIIIIPLLILMNKKGESKYMIIIYSLFIMYIFGFFAQICFPINYHGTSIVDNIKKYPYNEYIYLIPFKQKYFDMNQNGAVTRIMKSYILNIILTIPFGILYPIIKSVTTKKIIFISLLVGLTSELIQLSVGLLFGNQFRITHIDDVIMNAIGVMIGYAIINTIKGKYFKDAIIQSKYTY